MLADASLKIGVAMFDRVSFSLKRLLIFLLCVLFATSTFPASSSMAYAEDGLSLNTGSVADANVGGVVGGCLDDTAGAADAPMSEDCDSSPSGDADAGGGSCKETETSEFSDGQLAFSANDFGVLPVDSSRQLDLSQCSITVAEYVEYSGSAAEPPVSVVYGGSELKNGCDYTVEYQNNNAVGVATVTVRGIGDCYGEEARNFTIVKEGHLPSSGDLLVTTEDGSVLKWKKDGTASAKIVGYVSLTENLLVPSEIEGLSVIALADMAVGSAIIPNSTFAEADMLRSVVLPDSIKVLSGLDFQGCTSLESIRMSPNIVYIGMGAFEGCSSLESIELPAGLTKVDQVLFESCTSLRSVVLPSGLTSIGSGAFAGCLALKEISFPSKLTSIGGGAFEGSGLTFIELPSSLKTIGSTAFRSEQLVKVYIPKSVTSIGDAAFSSSTLILTDCVSNCTARTYAQNSGNMYIAGDLGDYYKSSVAAGVVFTGAEVRPEITLMTYYGDVFPMEYAELGYTDNVNCGRATCVITSDVVQGSQSVKFSIAAVAIGNESVSSADIPTQKYAGTPLEPSVTLMLGDYVLQEGIDYTCAYVDNSGLSSEGKVIVTGRGNFKGSRIVEFDVIDEGDTSPVLAERQTTSFCFPEQTSINARARIDVSENSEIGLALRLYDVSGKTTIALKDQDGKEQPLGVFEEGESASGGSYCPIMLPKGSYVLTVSGGISESSTSRSNITMYYWVKDEYENYAMEFEPNDTASSSTVIGALGYDEPRQNAQFVGSLYKPAASGTSEQGEDIDIFKFTLEDSSDTSIALKASNVLDYCVCDAQGGYVRDSSGREIFGTTDPGSTMDLIDCGRLEPGDYYLHISGNSSHKDVTQVYQGAVRIDPYGGFTDVDAGTAHYTDIAWLAGKGISQGWSAPGGKEFRPYSTVARADMAAFLYRLAGSPGYTAPSTSPFKDCDAETPHYKEICWLAEKGVSEGWSVAGGKEFRPYATVTRCDMAAFLYRMAGSPSYTAPSKSPFKDCDASTPHYKEVCWLAEKGVSEGWSVAGGKEFRSYNNVARADMAAFLHRMRSKGLA